MAFHKLINAQHIKYKRHGLNGNDEIHRTQSIGIKMIENVDRTTQTDGKNMVTKDAARAALSDV